MKRKERIKSTIISVSMILIGGFIGVSIIFPLIVDPYIVPITGMRPVMAVITAAVFAAPGIGYAKRNKSY